MKVLVFGEVLFDIFSSEEKIGGAAFNFAAHMARLGATVDLMTAIGSDERGKRVLQYFDKYGVKNALLATVEEPTGICRVKLDSHGVPTYDLVEQVAWDNIPWRQEYRDYISNGEYDIFYLGSLSQRGKVSSATLRELQKSVSCRWILFDCNIRMPYATYESMVFGLHCCTHLKVSREEAPKLAMLGVTPAYKDNYRYDWCKSVADEYGLKQVLLTLDQDGGAIYDRDLDAFIEHAGERVNVVSTVAAGDSFAAAYMASQLEGNDINTSLYKAILLSSQVVQSTGIFPSE